MAITHDPPTIALSSSPRAEYAGAKGKKDTLRNVETPPEVDEFVQAGLVTAPAGGRIDMHRLRPGGRLAGNLYTHVHDIFEMKRPSASYKG